MLFISEYSLNMKHMKICLKEMTLHMWKILHHDLQIPTRERSADECTLSGFKIWMLTNSTASWQTLAMSLYALRLNAVLKELKALNLLPQKGIVLHLHYLYIILYFVYQNVVE